MSQSKSPKQLGLRSESRRSNATRSATDQKKVDAMISVQRPRARGVMNWWSMLTELESGGGKQPEWHTRELSAPFATPSRRRGILPSLERRISHYYGMARRRFIPVRSAISVKRRRRMVSCCEGASYQSTTAPET